jgi:hypothetical protein
MRDVHTTKLLSAAAFQFVTGTDVHVVSHRGQARTPLEVAGATPCEVVQRAFPAGMDRGAGGHAITWRLALGLARNGSAPWSVTAIYWVPPASTPNAMVDGPRVALEGTWTTAKSPKFISLAPWVSP